MNTVDNINVSISLLILNDLHNSKTIEDDVYNLAVKKLYETDPKFVVSIITEKGIA